MDTSPNYACMHLWSAPNTAGTIQCAWCGKVVPAPYQYTSDKTTPNKGPHP